MKSSIIIIILISLISFSCQNQEKKPNSKEEKMKIQLTGLNYEHPNKKQMQWFLNNYKEEFMEDTVDLETMNLNNLIQKEFHFHTKLSNISLVLIFCKNQQDALAIGESNFSFNNENQKYGVNGAVLFVVKGKEKQELNNVLSWFSGEE